MPQAVATKRSIDQYTQFFEPTIPKEQRRYFERVKPLISKENSVANIERTDMISYLVNTEAALECMAEGQIGLGRFLMTMHLADLKLTMSFDGKVIESIVSNKFEYTQRQDVHEHVDYPKRKGFFGGRG